MKNRSTIAAIILSLSLATSAQAGFFGWMAGAVFVNIVPAVAGYANMYWNWRNSMNISAIQQDVNVIKKDVQKIGGDLGNLNNKVDRNHGEVIRDLALANQNIVENTELLTDVLRSSSKLAK